MTTSTNQTEITVDATVPLVRITREFDAPPEKVFRAHSDPALFARWNGPRDTRMTVDPRPSTIDPRPSTIDHHDCRTGGSYRYVIASGGFDAGFHGSFHDVRPGELIVQTFTFEGVPDGVALEKLIFEDIGNGRTRLVGTSLVDSFEDRDAFVASGMEYGIREGYERLDELLAD